MKNSHRLSVVAIVAVLLAGAMPAEAVTDWRVVACDRSDLAVLKDGAPLFTL